MGKPLDNRQLVKNPRKRDQYSPTRKNVPTPLSPKPGYEQLQRLKRISGGGEKD